MMKHHIDGGVFLPEAVKRPLNFGFLARAVCAWAVCAAALLLCGTVLFASDLSSLSALGYASSAISFFAALGAGTAAASDCRERRLLMGFITAACLCALLLLIGFLIQGSFKGSAALSVASFTLAGCLLGAILPRGKKRKRRIRPGGRRK